MIKNILKSNFGINCKVEEAKVKGLALYMTAEREFYMVNAEGFSFLLIKMPSDDRFGAKALETQLITIKDIMDCEVAFSFDCLTKLQRDALITRRIPFVAGIDQVYLPFMGIVFRNNLKSYNTVSKEKMMPATQSLFLYLLYDSQHKYILKKQAAEYLGLTRTSITRASEQLKAMGLITEEPNGREVRMKAVKEGLELYQAAKPYLISPVQRKVYMEKNPMCEGLPLAGESALSSVSMLGKPRYDNFAINKSDNTAKLFKEIDVKWQENSDTVQIEFWKYDPKLFSKHGIVDPISLALSLSNNDDERVQGELDRYMEEYKW